MYGHFVDEEGGPLGGPDGRPDPGKNKIQYSFVRATESYGDISPEEQARMDEDNMKILEQKFENSKRFGEYVLSGGGDIIYTQMMEHIADAMAAEDAPLFKFPLIPSKMKLPIIPDELPKEPKWDLNLKLDRKS